MDKHQRERDKLLQENGAVLVRSGKHRVFRLEDGRNFITASTPSTRNNTVASLSELRRLLRSAGVKQSFVEPQNEDAEVQQVQHKFRASNLDPHEQGTVIIPADTEEKKMSALAAFRFKCIVEVLRCAELSDYFWQLDSSARVRCLISLVKEFAQCEVLPLQFCRTSLELVARQFSLEGAGGVRAVLAAVEQGEMLPYIRTLSEWKLTGLPGLLVDDPILGPTLVDPNSWSLAENINYIFVRLGDLKEASLGVTSLVWTGEEIVRPDKEGQEPDHGLYMTFISKSMAKRKKFAITTSAQWKNMAGLRSALEQIQLIAIMLDQLPNS